MKFRQYFLILISLTGIILTSTLLRAQPPVPGNRYSSLSPPHPALAGVSKFRLSILRMGARAEDDGLDWAELVAMVSEKFRKTGIELPAGNRYSDPNMPELRIYIDMLKLEASKQYVFRIQTSLARVTNIVGRQTPLFKAEIWKVNPIMQAASVEDMPAEVVDIVLDQVNAFIGAYLATNPRGGQFESNQTPTSQNNAGPNVVSAADAGKYVASNSSGIFHRPDCRWAGNISAENLVAYRTRDEAIQSGKRPCKSCEP